jgi:phosphoglycolate phosphatase-like HAD superfamily hydrolase
VTVHVLHENSDWMPPFAAAFAAEGVDWDETLVTGGSLDLTAEPPPGLWWSRMSASAHTRGHTAAAEHARALLDLLEAHGRRVVNGRAVLDLELSKVRQLALLGAAGIAVPRTVAVVGGRPDDVLAAAAAVGPPVVVKPNRGGKGLGVTRFDSLDELAAALPASAGRRGSEHRRAPQGPEERSEPEGPQIGVVEPVDGVLLVQEYVEPARPRITRAEIVGGELVYAITADTGRGGFQLCPADACAVDGTPDSLFALRTEPLPAGLADAYESFARWHGLEVAGFEVIETADGRAVTYDVNTNTNYNPDVEAVAPRSAARAVARYLGTLDKEVSGS